MGKDYSTGLEINLSNQFRDAKFWMSVEHCENVNRNPMHLCCKLKAQTSNSRCFKIIDMLDNIHCPKPNNRECTLPF